MRGVAWEDVDDPSSSTPTGSDTLELSSEALKGGFQLSGRVTLEGGPPNCSWSV
jgi:hypothetical protein